MGPMNGENGKIEQNTRSKTNTTSLVILGIIPLVIISIAVKVMIYHTRTTTLKKGGKEFTELSDLISHVLLVPRVNC